MARRKAAVEVSEATQKPTIKYYFVKDLKSGNEVEGSAYVVGTWFSRQEHHSNYRVITVVRETGEVYDSGKPKGPSVKGTLMGCLCRVKAFEAQRFASKDDGSEWAEKVLASRK